MELTFILYERAAQAYTPYRDKVVNYLTFTGYRPKAKAKAKAYNTCRAPQVTYRDFRGAGHVTGQASVGRRP